MRYIKAILIITLIIVLFTACATYTDSTKSEVKISNDTVVKDEVNNTEIKSTNSYSLTKTYSNSELNNIVDFIGTLPELIKEYPTESIMLSDNYTHVSYRSNNKLAVLLFDELGNKYFSKLYNCTKPKSDFDDLKQGDDIALVKEIEPEGDYSSLYASHSKIPMFSKHYTKDGYIVEIYYNESLCIEKIEFVPLFT